MTGAYNTYRDLIGWQRSMSMTGAIYAVTRRWPEDDRYGLTTRIRRVAVSVPSNIAEGHARKSQREFAQFLRIALGSVAEIETQLLLARQLEYRPIEQLDAALDLTQVVGRLITRLRQSVVMDLRAQGDTRVREPLARWDGSDVDFDDDFTTSEQQPKSND